MGSRRGKGKLKESRRSDRDNCNLEKGQVHLSVNMLLLILV